jgi:hypothetical protein
VEPMVASGIAPVNWSMGLESQKLECCPERMCAPVWVDSPWRYESSAAALPPELLELVVPELVEVLEVVELVELLVLAPVVLAPAVSTEKCTSHWLSWYTPEASSTVT